MRKSVSEGRDVRKIFVVPRPYGCKDLVMIANADKRNKVFGAYSSTTRNNVNKNRTFLIQLIAGGAVMSATGSERQPSYSVQEVPETSGVGVEKALEFGPSNARGSARPRGIPAFRIPQSPRFFATWMAERGQPHTSAGTGPTLVLRSVAEFPD